MKITAMNSQRQIKEYDVVLTYHSEIYNKHYIVYTENKYNKKHELILYISEYDYNNPEQIVDNIENQKEYNEIKTEIEKILSELKQETKRI